MAGPAFSTRSRVQILTAMDDYAKEVTPGLATTNRDALASAATVALPTAKKNISSLDSHIAPSFYFGKSTEDAFEFINYVEKSAA